MELIDLETQLELKLRIIFQKEQFPCGQLADGCLILSPNVNWQI